MKKKIIALTSAVILVLSLSATAFAAPSAASHRSNSSRFTYSLMCDADRNLLTQEDFEENLDKAIEDGYIQEEDRDYYVDMYDYCLNNGGFSGGGGCCGGRGGFRR